MIKNFTISRKAQLIIFMFFLAVTGTLQPQTITGENELINYLNSKDTVYENICIEFGKETWDLYSGEDASNIYTPKSKMASFLTDKEFTENIDYWYGNISKISNETAKRKVIVWRSVIYGTKIELDPDVKDVATNLLEELRNRDDKDTIKNKQLEKQVIELIRIRNKKARELGYENYAYYILDYFGIGQKWFQEFAEAIDRHSAPVYKELQEKVKSETGSVTLKEIMKYYKQPESIFFEDDSNHIIMKKSLSDIGFDYDKLPIRFVVKPADFGGNCIGVKIPGDFRVVMVPDMPISVFMHELGHGLQGIYTSTNTGLLEGYEWCLGNSPAMFYEGMAETMAEFTRTPAWLKKYAGYSDEKIAETFKQDKYAAALRMRVNLQWMLSEIEVYKNEDKNPAEITNALFKKIYFTDENRSRPYNLLNTSFVDYPCYMQNYVIAEFIRWQVHQTLKEKFGENYPQNNQVGNFLVENFYKYGVSKDWREIIKDATGKELDVDGYLISLGL